MSNQPTAETPDAIFEQTGQLSRQFRKQIAKGEAHRIERFLGTVADSGKENLFSSLLDVEISFASGCKKLLQHVAVADKATQANELAAVPGMGSEVLSLL
ncbi:MAG: hypothetical protein P1U77_13290 [Rubripirellula sp.]|jgi:hypothetical protein|nr:hypothetical protein [Rubripirellula sp.]